MVKKVLFSVLAFKIMVGILIFACLSFTGYAGSIAQESNAAKLDKIVAVVNGDVITQSELDKKIAWIKRRNNISPEQQNSVLQKQVLDESINTLLQLQLAERSGISFSDVDVNRAIAKIAHDNHFTLDQFKKELENDGVTFKEYREQIHDQMILAQVRQRFLGRDVVVDAADVAAILRHPPKQNVALAQYHVIDILIETTDSGGVKQIDNSKQLARQIVTKLRVGVDIDKILQEYNAASRQVRSDDLGWRRINELPTLYIQVVTGMKVGQISDPVQAPNGFHVLKLLEMRGDSPVKLTKERAQEIAYNQKLEVRLKAWIKELRSVAYIKIN